MKTTYYASVYVIRPTAGGHEVLLGLRAAEKYMGGTWQLISGGIEPGETAWQAAVREVGEETGLPIRALYRLPRVEPFYRVDTDSICTAVLFCAITDAAAEPTINPEHTALAWVSIDAAREQLMWPSDRAGLDDVVTQIIGDGMAKAYLRVSIGMCRGDV